MHSFLCEKVWHTIDGWMDGWMDGRVGLRIAYSNQKLTLLNDPSKKISSRLQAKCSEPHQCRASSNTWNGLGPKMSVKNCTLNKKDI